MKLLGLEINLSKSIISKDNPTFEFAKRTYSAQGINISAIPWKQLITMRSLAERVENSYKLTKSCGINKVSVFSKVISRSKDLIYANASFEALGLLNLLAQKELIKWNKVLNSVVDPKGLNFDLENITNFILPVKTILNQVLLLHKNGVFDDKLSKINKREAWTLNFTDKFCKVVCQSIINSLNKVDSLYNKKINLEPLRLCDSRSLSYEEERNLKYIYHDIYTEGPLFDISEMYTLAIGLFYERKNSNRLELVLKLRSLVLNKVMVLTKIVSGRSKYQIFSEQLDFIKLIYKTTIYKPTYEPEHINNFYLNYYEDRVQSFDSYVASKLGTPFSK